MPDPRPDFFENDKKKKKCCIRARRTIRCPTVGIQRNLFAKKKKKSVRFWVKEPKPPSLKKNR